MNNTSSESELNVQNRRWNPGLHNLTLADAIWSAAWCCIIAFLALGADALAPNTLNNWFDLGAVLGLLAVGLLWLQLARSKMIWNRLKSSLKKARYYRNDVDKRVIRVGFREMFAYLVLSLSVLAALAFNAGNPSIPHIAEVDLQQTNHICIFLFFLALSFAPLIRSNLREAKFDAHRRSKQHGSFNSILRSDVVSGGSLSVTAGVIAAIVYLAYLAGKNENMTIEQDFGIIVTIAVIIAFISFIFLPHIAAFMNERNEEMSEAAEGMKPAAFAFVSPPVLISWFDSLLVRLIAPLSGATQNGRGIPHLLVILVMLPLTALGYALPAPYGLIPIITALIISVALGRRWAWVESDRETASRLQSTKGREIHIGFSNDLRDEALLGYAFLFVLVPLALRQLNAWSPAFEGGDGTFINWIQFFGLELAKAVPFVDWAEIYGFNPAPGISTIEGAGATGKHLVFGARVLVDFVIMAALFQALSIWQRSRTQHTLYDSGQLNAFDPFTEQSFFERGMQSYRDGRSPHPKKKFRDRVGKHVDERRALGLPLLPYSQRRLSELVSSDNADTRAGARWMIQEFGVLAGEPKVQIAQLRKRWFGIQFATASEDEIIREKLDFERVLSAARQQSSTVTDKEIGLIVAMLHDIKQLPEFAYAELLAFRLIGHLQSKRAVNALALSVMSDTTLEKASKWADLLKNDFGEPLLNIRQGTVEMRIKVYQALQHLGTNKKASKSARTNAYQVSKIMASPKDMGGDTAGPGRQAAAIARDAIEDSLNGTD